MNTNINKKKKEYSEVSDKDLKINSEYFNLFQNELNQILVSNKHNNVTKSNDLEVNSVKTISENNNKQILTQDVDKKDNNQKIKNKKFDNKKILDNNEKNINKDIIKIDDKDILAIKMLIDFFRNNNNI